MKNVRALHPTLLILNLYKKYNMVLRTLKYILCTIAIFFNFSIFSQIKMNDYLVQWKKVESFEKKGLTKSGIGKSLGAKKIEEVKVRKNFNETAFFFPQLKTDAEGNVEFSFTIPEALTQWKLLTLAHTKNAASGYTEKTMVTQKPLMVQPNAPRFIR